MIISNNYEQGTTHLAWTRAGFDAAASTSASSEYMLMGELNWFETIFFGVPPIVTVLTAGLEGI